jgi:hypothetical protein
MLLVSYVFPVKALKYSQDIELAQTATTVTSIESSRVDELRKAWTITRCGRLTESC